MLDFWNSRQKDTRELLLVSGSPRSTTTALHNAFISSGLFKGILADDLLDRDPHIDQSLYTDEYYPSMRSAIAWCFASSRRKKREFAREISKHVSDLYSAFGASHGLMLKAPHYAFGLRAYARIFPNLKVIVTHRNPISVAASMLKHPHISSQLPLGLQGCTDFLEFSLLEEYSDPNALEFVKCEWENLSQIERALFVWHLYGSGFLKSAATTKFSFVVIQNEEFGPRDLWRIADLLGIPLDEVDKISKHYRALSRRESTDATLSEKGEKLWRIIKWVDDTLTMLARR